MGVTGALNLISSAVTAYGSYQQGKAEQAQAEANAKIYEAQAKNIKEAQKITAEQYRSKANVLRGQATTTAARNGLRISGTTANSISQSIMQLQMDNSYEQYNLQVQRQNAFDNAALQRYQGQIAYTNGLMRAGSTALKAGASYYDKYWKNSNISLPKKKGTLYSGGLKTNQDTLYSNDVLIG